MNNQLAREGLTEILGREIEFYGSWEEPYFLAKSVAEWIDNKNHRDLLTRIDDEDKVVGSTDTLGGVQKTTFLTEDGLYEVLMQSRKPIAKELKKKIKQYLKQVRITGGAVEEGREEEFINKYFPSFSEEAKLSMVQDLLRTNKELKPKADYCDKVLKSDKLLTTTEIAKDMGMSARALNQKLNDLGIIFKKGGVWHLYSSYQDRVPEYADYIIAETYQQLKWTEKGRQWLLELTT